jgi:hypothetical protein
MGLGTARTGFKKPTDGIWAKPLVGSAVNNTGTSKHMPHGFLSPH